MRGRGVGWATLGMWTLVAVMTVVVPVRGQIPVIDTSSILKQLEQIAELKKQLETAQQQLSQLQSLHGSLNKLTNMGEIASLLNNPAVRTALPKEFGQMEAALRGGGTGSMGQRATAYQQQNEHYTRDGDDFYATELRRGQQANP